MIDSLLLHPQTRREIDAMVRDPSHAVLLSGVNGMGKGTLARALATSYLKKANSEALLSEAYFREITPHDGTIGIEAVRELRQFTMLKTTGKQAIRRVVIIHDAQSMTTEAQNAFLKLLEEPPADTAIIITVSDLQHLLPTVLSRVQHIRVLPPSKEDVVKYFEGQGKATAEIERSYLLSDGATGLLHALLSDDSSHPLVAQVQQAKEVYGKSMFERLALVEGLSKQKDQISGLLAAFKRITNAAMKQAIAKGQNDVAEKWHSRLQAVYDAEKALSRNANAKLLLTNLFLNL